MEIFMNRSLFSKFVAVICVLLTLSLLLVACKDTSGSPEGTTAAVTTTSDPSSNTEKPTVTKATYKITVKNESDQPLSGVSVQLYAGETCAATVSTDTNGLATVELDKAVYTVKVSFDGYSADEYYDFPAGSTELQINMKKLGTEDNPYLVDFTWNDAQIEASAKVKVPAGETVYFGQYRIGGMLLSINGGEAMLLESKGMMVPASFSITNSTSAEAEYTLSLFYRLGSMMKPATLVIGSNVASVDADSQGYFYTFTAASAGELEITMSGDNWTYTVNNITTSVYGNIYSTKDATVTASSKISVNAGDVIQIIVGSADGTEVSVSFSAAFTANV